MKYQTEKSPQVELIEVELDWREHWQGMPEFVQGKQRAFAQVIVRFASQEDLDNFSKLIGQKLTRRTKSIWHPAISHWGRKVGKYVNES